MKREVFRDLGQMFYDWYKTDRVKFVYGTEGRDCEIEIEHISELIEYVKKKKESLLQGKTVRA